MKPIDPMILLAVLGAVTIILILAIGYLFRQQMRLKEWYRRLCNCEEACTLAEAVERSNATIAENGERLAALEAEVRNISKQLPHAFSRVGLVRYNPFQDIGGDNSFSLAIADESGRGVVITALYTREHSRVYAKPLEDWTSLRQLTDEERKAIEQARGR